ncbi:MAG: ATP-dependent zinc metalloprotease FtsH [Paludibacteraceae bacterium]|nr:ATP-dependent zinc metalloprotease FtsH [Paludibacteraceae bacterium]MBO5988037.1 ATP-dependent zinc metalloprotease FtsH [Paludibacteraceae bacterium]
MAEKKQDNKDSKFKGFSLYWLYGLIVVGLIAANFMDTTPMSKEIAYNEIKSLIEKKAVEEIRVISNKNIAEIKIKEDKLGVAFEGDSARYKKNPVISVSIPSADKFTEELNEWQKGSKNNVALRFEEDKDYFQSFFFNLFPFLLLAGIWFFIMRRMSSGGGGGGVFSVGKSKAQLFDKTTGTRVTFKDVAGLSEAKQEVEEIVSFLKNPSKYTELGGKIPKGALLVGPPGTGKTLLAKAVAGEAEVPFFSLSGSDFVEMFVGVGASRVRDLFRQAKEKAPCIVFIDEIDAIGRARGKNLNMGGNDERENTLNQLLTEMDGFGSNSGVIILAATNRVEILDKALLRAGRFDRQISVDLPDVHDRKEIFNVHLKPLKLDDSVDIDFLSRQTPGFSGADIANVCNEAALIAARRSKKFVDKQDFLDAVDRIIGGLEKKNKIMTKAEKEAVAFHEAGHATVSWMLEYANPLVKVTIVPRGKALGAAWYLPEERQLTTKEQLLDEMCATLGGRASEDLTFGKISTGALNDLERTNKQAYAMIAYYGMSDKLQNLCYYDSSGQSAYSFSKPYSEETAKLIDDEVKKLIEEQYERAKAILTEHKEGLAELAKILIEREVIFADDLEKIFGKRPWASRTEELMEANAKNKEAEKEDMEEETEKPLPAENDEADETDENVAEKEKQNNASENDLN